MNDVFIAGSARTPFGAFNGSFSLISSVKLGSVVIGEAVKRSGLDPADVEEVIMGNIFSSGLGPMPAREAALEAGLPGAVRAAILDNGFLSGLSSVTFAARAIAAGDVDVAIAGGMENMTRAPYLLEKARFGYRLGNSELVDPIMKDCLWDERNDFHVAMGAENIARRSGITREEQDRYARQSYSRAIGAGRNGYLNEEVVPITIPIGRDKFASFNTDEGPQKYDPEGFSAMSPFVQDGTVTVGNSSTLADGAAALVIVSGRAVKRFGLRPLARVSGWAFCGVAPEMFSLAPAGAIEGLFRKTGTSREDVDMFEINEDFAASVLAVIKEAGLDESRININGGSIAIGSPGGASGARLVVSLLTAMKRAGARKGVAALGAPGGEAAAMLVEMIGD